MEAYFCTVCDLSDGSLCDLVELGETKAEAASAALETRMGAVGDYEVTGSAEWNLEAVVEGYRVESVFSLRDLETMASAIREEEAKFATVLAVALRKIRE